MLQSMQCIVRHVKLLRGATRGSETYNIAVYSISRGLARRIATAIVGTPCSRYTCSYIETALDDVTTRHTLQLPTTNPHCTFRRRRCDFGYLQGSVS